MAKKCRLQRVAQISLSELTLLKRGTFTFPVAASEDRALCVSRMN